MTQMPSDLPAAAPILPAGALIQPETVDMSNAIEVLNSDVFGPGRFAKTAYRLRRNNPPVLAFNRVCMLQDRLIGAVCFSRIRIGAQSALLLGPLAVDRSFKNQGVGVGLMQAGIAAAQEAGEALVVLVGDPPYYARAGFSPVAMGQIAMPGPVD